MSTDYTVEIFGSVEDPYDDYADIYVELKDGTKYVATFFTLKYIGRRMKHHRETGENSGGIYFWHEDMCIIESLDQATVESSVRDMLDNGSFAQVFDEVISVDEGDSDDEDFVDPVDTLSPRAS